MRADREYVVEQAISRWGRVDHEEIRVDAGSAADAIKKARKMNRDAGWTRQDGSIQYRARLAA